MFRKVLTLKVVYLAQLIWKQSTAVCEKPTVLLQFSTVVQLPPCTFRLNQSENLQTNTTLINCIQPLNNLWKKIFKKKLCFACIFVVVE